jgi:hypothetical protein
MTSPETNLSSFKSRLGERSERYLAQQMVYALQHGWRTADDFLRHFGPRVIMEALANADELRSEILVKAAGVHAKLANKKSLESGAEDLQLALDEGITKPEDVLELFHPDDRIRYLDSKKIWAFLTEDEFFFTLPAEEQLPRAVERMTFMVDDALSEGILDLQSVLDGITFDEISRRLPLASLQKIVKHALLAGRLGVPLSEEMLLEAVPFQELIRHIPLDHIWNEVIIARVARPEGFAAAEDASAPIATASAVPAPAPAAAAASPAPAPSMAAAPPAGSVQSPASTGGSSAKKGVSPSPVPVSATRSAVPPPMPATPRSVVPPPIPQKKSKKKNDAGEAPALSIGVPPPLTPPAASGHGRDSVVDIDMSEFDEQGEPSRAAGGSDVSSAAGRSPQDEARRRVTRSLEKIGRLPPSHEKLAVPILLSIESMYAELPALASDERREACIRESFPNEQHLRTAMLALVELLDPSVDVHDVLIAEAEIDSLVSLVLFEENRRADLVVRPSAMPGR